MLVALPPLYSDQTHIPTHMTAAWAVELLHGLFRFISAIGQLQVLGATVARFFLRPRLFLHTEIIALPSSGGGVLHCRPMNDLEYPCPTCKKPSKFVKKISPKVETNNPDEPPKTYTALMVECPEHGEMVIPIQP